MAGQQGRGIFRLIWKNFIASVSPRATRRKLIGEDLYGTKYYEAPILKGSARKTPRRYYVPLKEDFPEMPAEWESWLRYRRTEPPTSEEIERNMQIALTKKKNAAELEQRNMTDKPQIGPSASDPHSFPTYDDYKRSDKH